MLKYKYIIENQPFCYDAIICNKNDAYMYETTLCVNLDAINYSNIEYNGTNLKHIEVANFLIQLMNHFQLHFENYLFYFRSTERTFGFFRKKEINQIDIDNDYYKAATLFILSKPYDDFYRFKAIEI